MRRRKAEERGTGRQSKEACCGFESAIEALVVYRVLTGVTQGIFHLRSLPLELPSHISPLQDRRLFSLRAFWCFLAGACVKPRVRLRARNTGRS